jgi:hypothetical protein
MAATKEELHQIALFEIAYELEVATSKPGKKPIGIIAYLARNHAFGKGHEELIRAYAKQRNCV